MALVQQLNDLKDDVKVLLEYSQKLKAENDELKRILSGSVVFLGRGDKEKVYRVITGSGVASPSLKSVENGSPGVKSVQVKPARCGMRNTEHKQLLVSPHPEAVLPNDTQSRSFPKTSFFTEAKRQNSALSTVNGDREEGNCRKNDSNPVLHTRTDLTDILLEHNKLQARLAQFMSNISPSSTASPNICKHRVTDVSVVGCQDHPNKHEFVIHVTWTNGQRFMLYRKYQDFFMFQATLKGLFARKHGKESPLPTMPNLPLSDHLLIVLGRLNSQAELHQRIELVERFCKAVVSDVAGKSEEDICRTSVLVFFTSRTGDIEIQSPLKEAEVVHETRPRSQALHEGSQLDEDEVISDDDIEDCLGFVSSVAEANDVNWHDKHSDLVDIPKPKALPAVESTSLRFTTPSSAPPVIANTLPTTEMVDTPRLRKTKTPAIPNLSILKSTQSTDTVTQKYSWTLPDSDSTVTDSSSEPITSQHAKKEVRVRCYNFNNRDLSLARTKALHAKSGNTDWGVRVSAEEAK